MRYYFDKPTPRKAPSGPIIKRLLIRCPSTAKLADTGQTVEEQVWGTTKPKGSPFLCPHCRQLHSWTKKDVVLAASRRD